MSDIDLGRPSVTRVMGASPSVTRNSALKAAKLQQEYASLDAVHIALRTLDDLTTEQFSNGGDRPTRKALVRYLHANGYPLETDELREYGVAVLLP